MIKILVLGSTGLLGSTIVPELKRYGFRVITSARSGSVDLKGDATKKHEIHRILEVADVDVILNLCGLTSVEDCEIDVKRAYEVNAGIVENIVSFIVDRQLNNCHLIHISTDQVYCGDGESAESDIQILNNYALTKYAGDLIAQKIPSTILRTNFIGKSLNPSRQSLTDWVLSNALDGKEIQVLSDVFFSPVSMKFMAKILSQIINLKPVGIYNLGSRKGLSKADFDLMFARKMGLDIKKITPIKLKDAKFLKAKRPHDMRMNINKIENILDMRMPELVDLIDEIVEEYCDV